MRRQTGWQSCAASSRSQCVSNANSRSMFRGEVAGGEDRAGLFDLRLGEIVAEGVRQPRDAVLVVGAHQGAAEHADVP